MKIRSTKSTTVTEVTQDEARNILELARYANVHTQKPLTDSELKFIYYYPDIAAKVMTVEPYYQPTHGMKRRIESSGKAIIY